MPAVKDPNEVTLHLKTQRQSRDRLLGSLRSRGTTMQSFFDRLIDTLNNDPARLEEVLTWQPETKPRRRDPQAVAS